MAQSIIQREKPEIEAQLNQLAPLMQEDEHLMIWMHRMLSSPNPAPIEDSATNHLLNHYFNQNWNNYNIQITICTPAKELIVQPQN